MLLLESEGFAAHRIDGVDVKLGRVSWEWMDVRCAHYRGAPLDRNRRGDPVLSVSVLTVRTPS